MAQNFDLSRAADELIAYAVERQAGFRHHRQDGSHRQPEPRNDWVRDILRGMAEMNGADGGALTARFDQQIEGAQERFRVKMLSRTEQKHIVQSLRQYVSAPEQLSGGQRERLMMVRNLLEDMTVYPLWDPEVIGIYSARDCVTEQLLRLTAQRPIRFTRILLGDGLDSGGVAFMPGLVDDAKDVRRTREFQRLTAAYSKREEWPALCTVYQCGGQGTAPAPADADEFDMKLIRDAGDHFLKQPGVNPVGSHQLCVPVYEQIRVLKVEPYRVPEEITISNRPGAFREVVGGDIETVGLDSGVCLVCNELGRLTGLPANRRVNGEAVAGTFLIVGCADGDFCSLSDGDAAYYDRELSEPALSYDDPDQPAQWEFCVL